MRSCQPVSRPFRVVAEPQRPARAVDNASQIAGRVVPVPGQRLLPRRGGQPEFGDAPAGHDDADAVPAGVRDPGRFTLLGVAEPDLAAAPVGYRDQRQLGSAALEPPRQAGPRVGDRERAATGPLQPPPRPGDRQPGQRHRPVLGGAARPGQDPPVREHASDPVRGDLQPLIEAGGPRRPEPPARPPRGPVGPADDQREQPGQRHVVLEQQHVPGRHVDRIRGLRDIRRGPRRQGRICDRVPGPAGPVGDRAGYGHSVRPVGVRGSRPRHERIPGRAGQRLGLVRQIGEPVVHRLARLVRRSEGRERTAAALPGRAANGSATCTSRPRSRA